MKDISDSNKKKIAGYMLEKQEKENIKAYFVRLLNVIENDIRGLDKIIEELKQSGK